MERNQTVLVQITIINNLLAETGVSSYCAACFKRPSRSSWYSRLPTGGCCSGCSNLGPDGCTEKPLACALWLCGHAQNQFPEVHDKLEDIAERFPRVLARGFRHDSLAAEKDFKG